MHNDQRRLPLESRARWTSLIEHARVDMDVIVQDFVAMAASLPSYKAGILNAGRLEADAYRIFGVLLQALTVDGELSGEIRSAARRIGEERAAIGVALPDLRAALRSDFFILWDKVTSAMGPEDHVITAHAAPYLVRTIEAFVAEVEKGYERATGGQLAQRFAREQQLLPLLINGSALMDEQLRVVANAMNSVVDEPYVVCVTSADQSVAFDQFEIKLRLHGRPGLTHWSGTHLLIVLPATAENRRILDSIPTLHAGISEPIPSLRHVPRATQLAIDVDASRLPSEKGQLRYRDVWHRLAAKRLFDITPEFYDAISSALASAGPEELDTLRSTIIAVTENSTIGEAAARLICHRNTVQNRLARVAQLTGFDVSQPKWLFLLYIYALGSSHIRN